jgi:hypothetical protein
MTTPYQAAFMRPRKSLTDGAASLAHWRGSILLARGERHAARHRDDDKESTHQRPLSSWPMGDEARARGEQTGSGANRLNASTVPPNAWDPYGDPRDRPRDMFRPSGRDVPEPNGILSRERDDSLIGPITSIFCSIFSRFRTGVPQWDTRRVGVLGLFKTPRMPINRVNPGSPSSRERFRIHIYRTRDSARARNVTWRQARTPWLAGASEHPRPPNPPASILLLLGGRLPGM